MLHKWHLDCLVANEVYEAHVVKTGLVVDPEEPEIYSFKVTANGCVGALKQEAGGLFLIRLAHLVLKVAFPKFDLRRIERQCALEDFGRTFWEDRRKLRHHLVVERVEFGDLSQQTLVFDVLEH